MILACRSWNDRRPRKIMKMCRHHRPAASSHRICTGLPRRRLGKLIAGLAGLWQTTQESRPRDRRGHQRQRAAGAGPATI
jgi:hypothetical protein